MSKTVVPKVKYLHWKYRVMLSFFAAYYLNTPTQYKSLLVLLKQQNYYEAFLFSFLMSCLMIWALQKITVYLDNRIPWEKEPLRRIVGQLLWGVGSILLAVYLAVSVYFRLVGADIEQSGYLTLEFPLVQAMVVVLNMIYTCMYFAFRLFKSQTVHPGNECLSAMLGKKNYFVSIKDIAYLLRENKIGYVVLKNERRLNISYKMDELEEILDPNLFFRINRSVIYTLDAVEGYRSEKNAQCSLIIKNGYPVCDNVLVSRNRAKKLKKILGRLHSGMGGDGSIEPVAAKLKV